MERLKRPTTGKNNSQPYQLMPPLSDAEYAELKDSIERHGVLIPVEKDKEGNIIDGHYRVKICKELGITCPFVERDYPDEQAKRTRSRELNLARRHLTHEAKQAIIRAELKENPDRSNRAIASALGVSDKTVGTARAELEATAEITQSEKTTGKDGKKRSARKNAGKRRLFIKGAATCGNGKANGADKDKARKDWQREFDATVHDLIRVKERDQALESAFATFAQAFAKSPELWKRLITAQALPFNLNTPDQIRHAISMADRDVQLEIWRWLDKRSEEFRSP